MTKYSYEELTEALRAINSIIHKCEKAQEKFPLGNSHHTLLKNRLKAMYISKELITAAAKDKPPAVLSPSDNPELLISDLDRLHTTRMGAARIRDNLQLGSQDAVEWCRERIAAPHSHIARRGKNWYITTDGCEITVNANSCTIITAHKAKA